MVIQLTIHSPCPLLCFNGVSSPSRRTSFSSVGVPGPLSATVDSTTPASVAGVPAEVSTRGVAASLCSAALHDVLDGLPGDRRAVGRSVATIWAHPSLREPQCDRRMNCRLPVRNPFRRSQIAAERPGTIGRQRRRPPFRVSVPVRSRGPRRYRAKPRSRWPAGGPRRRRRRSPRRLPSGPRRRPW